MDGIIIIKKPKNYTSHDIVYKVRKILKEKVGHTGTLDPMATGVLPLLIGKGTKVSKYLINHDKTYIVKLQLGKRTATGDTEGKIIEEKDVPQNNLKEEKINEVLLNFKGKQQQIPPIYSAIKVNGKKLYEYARKGQVVEIKPRSIEIYNIKLLQIDEKLKQIEFEVECSKGTYIRSLCEDIAFKLDTVGYMEELNRTKVGNFLIENAVTIDELEENIEDLEKLENSVINLEKLFEKKEKIELDNEKLELFLNGVKLSKKSNDGLYRIYNKEKEFIGLGIVANNFLKRDIII